MNPQGGIWVEAFTTLFKKIQEITTMASILVPYGA
jgi:hypothetical protein